ncbi:MAG: hypothetical protein K0R59_4145 [Sphingobacterium sp.]|jgi:hypothetical protein|uniref:hypothetical protein n=1 Tax=Sphingobacterium sp. CZ-UAM TaxID=1933868 RepID=UPI000986A0AC|nr:hypothetical protein [Sphingobacterium sp. CZ-UAM]MDF2518849.1 hypothetical protein [Sphingobacterium sp.]OOG17692.1 hypothetical protein BWD42_15350 [Sphingobacterium sp. CZ-UAM]
MRKNLIVLMALAICAVACNSKKENGVPVVNLEALSAIPLDHSIDTLAKGTAFIDVTLPANARIDELSQQELGLLKAAAYRFYRHVSLEDNQYKVDIKDPKSLHIADQVVTAYEQAITNTNHFADSMAKAGQAIQLPVVNAEYLNNLLK